jgi:hypothetical protein
MADSVIPIDFLYVEDCPSHDRALRLLEEVVAAEAIPAHIRVVKVKSEQEAQRLQFPGSPTIRVAGVDIDDAEAPAVGLSCRAYRHDNGRISPLPPRYKIEKALRELKAVS